MTIVPYQPAYRSAFVALNTQWIQTLFGALEPEDRATFDHLETHLQAGAMAFFAVENGQVLATCLTLPRGEGSWELCKLATDPPAQGRGAGSAVFARAMDYAVGQGARRLFLLSNRKLVPALHLYRKFGFREIPLENCEYARGDIAWEYLVKPSSPGEGKGAPL